MFVIFKYDVACPDVEVSTVRVARRWVVDWTVRLFGTQFSRHFFSKVDR